MKLQPPTKEFIVLVQEDGRTSRLIRTSDPEAIRMYQQRLGGCRHDVWAPDGSQAKRIANVDHRKLCPR